jgi:hypothetical protein
VRKRGWFARVFGWERPAPVGEQPVWVAGAVAEEPEPQAPAALVAEEPEEPPAEPETEDGTLNRDGAQAALESALEALGSAHHRPFSRG